MVSLDGLRFGLPAGQPQNLTAVSTVVMPANLLRGEPPSPQPRSTPHTQGEHVHDQEVRYTV